MLNHLKSHALSYSLAAVVVLFFMGQALVSSWNDGTNPFAPEPVEASIDVASAARYLVLEKTNLELHEQNDQLSSQNDQLSSQNDQLSVQNGQLYKANYKLTKENSQLHDANTELHVENTQLQQHIQRLHEAIKEKEELTESQKRELGLRHQQLANYEHAFDAMNAPTKAVKQAVMKQSQTDAGLIQLAKETLGVDVEVRECR